MASTKHRLQLSLRTFLLVPIALTLAVVLFGSMTKGCVSHSQFLAVNEGMNKAEVTAIMGKPAEIDEGHRAYHLRTTEEAGESWCYLFWGIGDACFVEFDENGIVIAVWG